MKKNKAYLTDAVKYTFLSLWAVTTIFPLCWIMMNSFKTSQQIIDDSFAMPIGLMFDNYRAAFERNILLGYFNSLTISVSVVIAVLLIGSLASYIIARFTFPGKVIIQG